MVTRAFALLLAAMLGLCAPAWALRNEEPKEVPDLLAGLEESLTSGNPNDLVVKLAGAAGVRPGSPSQNANAGAPLLSSPPDFTPAGLEEDVDPQRAKELLRLLLWGISKPVEVALADFAPEVTFATGATAVTMDPIHPEGVGIIEELLDRLPPDTRLRWEPSEGPQALHLVLRRREPPQAEAAPSELPQLPVPPVSQSEPESVELPAAPGPDEPAGPAGGLIVPHIRSMIRRDMPEVLEIEWAVERPAGAAPWGEDDFIRVLRQRKRNCHGMVAEHEDKVVGFMVYEFRKSHLQLLNMGVHPDYRDRGVGKALIDTMKGKLNPQRTPRIVADVREHDLDAQRFLKKQGFRATRTLFGWFDDTGEDVYVMVYRIPPAAGMEESSQARRAAVEAVAGRFRQKVLDAMSGVSKGSVESAARGVILDARIPPGVLAVAAALQGVGIPVVVVEADAEVRGGGAELVPDVPVVGSIEEARGVLLKRPVLCCTFWENLNQSRPVRSAPAHSNGALPFLRR